MTDHTYVITFETASAAESAKNTLRQGGIHAFVTPVQRFDRYPGRDAYRAALRNVTVHDDSWMYGVDGSLIPALERRLGVRLKQA